VIFFLPEVDGFIGVARCYTNMLVKKREQGSLLKPMLTLIIALASFCSKQWECLADSDVLNTFTESSVDSSQLRNFVYNDRDGVLYVGAVNVIYRLTMELQLNGSVLTGPQHDITDCRDASYQLASCNRASSVSPCVNQALVVDISSNSLIACGTLYHGSCTVFDLRTLTSDQSSFRPVVPSDASKSVVVVIGPGPTSKQTNALFVAAAYSRTANVSAAISNYGFLAVRKLPSFELAHFDQFSSSLIDIQPKYQYNFSVTFRRAFYLSNFVYYFAVRPKFYMSSEMTSHVLRVCAGDQKLKSLVELQLECKVNGIVYPYLRDMATWKLSTLVVIDNGHTKLEGNLLFGAFTISQTDAGDSAICAYRLSDVETTFQETIQKCFNGVGDLGPDYIKPTGRCTHTVRLAVVT
jgi:plexin A